MKRLSAVAGLFALALIASMPAHAMVVTFTGDGTFGIDPLGDNWNAATVGPFSWGEPGLGFGLDAFDTDNDTAPDGNADAVALSFTVQGGVPGGIIDPGGCNSPFFTTRFCDVTTDVSFIPTIVGNTVVFNAPAGDEISPGDEYFVNVVANDPAWGSFEFSATWSDRNLSVPEPASMALFGGGVFGLGLMRRKLG